MIYLNERYFHFTVLKPPFIAVNERLILVLGQIRVLPTPISTASLASWVERDTIYLWLWLFCAGGRRFAPRPWHQSMRSFSSSQATDKIISTEHAIYSQFIQNQSPWGSYKLQIIYVSPHLRLPGTLKTTISAIIIIIRQYFQ